ncbi:methyltransferase domain-containing protein [Methylomonas sp. AM2-LC]|uniref:class I SAM-dependent methyltransferase n=1 Tax=Methylomonas sp. AM2-LC TaxID=3153301 RepID=UPI00326775F8
MKESFKKFIGINKNEEARNQWLSETLAAIPPGLRILDAGAGELRNKPLCTHLNYVSQDVCQYQGDGDGQGLQTGTWDTSNIDVVCDITNIPEADASFDVILCSEVFEHLPDALRALDEFSRLLKQDGKLIITAPFASLVHFAPYHFVSGFSRYWYEYHLPLRNFIILELIPNGDWFSYTKQEILRLPGMARHYGSWCWPLAYLVTAIGCLYFSLHGKSRTAEDVGCFGWHCIAVKS